MKTAEKKTNYPQASDKGSDNGNLKKQIELVPLQIVISRNGKLTLKFFSNSFIHFMFYTYLIKIAL